MTTELTTLLVILAAAMVLVAGGMYWWTNRAPTLDRDPEEALPLFGTLSPAERARDPEIVPVARKAPPAPRPAPVIREFVTAPAVAPSPRAVAPPVMATVTEAPTGNGVASEPATVVSRAGVPGTMVEAHTVRFSVPAEGTLQFLPGRLEISAGLDAGREIRFVRAEGPNGIEVTFGRAEGELYRHIQLRDKTVSRAHARLQYREACWYLQNLSQTNPVVLNGVEMAGDAIQPLDDGDRIEMGEVLFTYRSR